LELRIKDRKGLMNIISTGSSQCKAVNVDMNMSSVPIYAYTYINLFTTIINAAKKLLLEWESPIKLIDECMEKFIFMEVNILC
jgi:hypothetical protein